VAKRVWTPEEIEKLKNMAAAGASAVRVSLALKRPINAVKDRARDEGVPFPHDKDFMKAQRAIAYR
jgi:hypothetical protein